MAVWAQCGDGMNIHPTLSMGLNLIHCATAAFLGGSRVLDKDKTSIIL